MYRIGKTVSFDSAHYLRGYIGKCARLHGHRWEVEPTISRIDTDELGMVIDFGIVKEKLKEIIDYHFDHYCINDFPPFNDALNPTAENIAAYLYQQLKLKLPPQVKLDSIKVWESPEAWAEYKE